MTGRRVAMKRRSVLLVFSVLLLTAGLGLLISLIYWLGYTFSIMTGYAGIMPPVLAAWIIPVLFGTLAVYLFITTPE